MIRPKARAIVCALFVLLALSNGTMGFSQGVSGTILGRVTDTTGAVVPGATVQLQNASTGFSQNAQTDSEGRYSARSLPLGTYTVTVQQAGFRSEVRTGIALSVASEVTVNVQLSVGNVQERVEVTAEAPLLETTNATVSGMVTQEQMRDLPLNGRSVDALALLSPGVFQNKNTFANPAVGAGIRLSVNGNRPDSMLYLLDGTATNDSSNNGHGGAAGQTLGVEGILEFRLLTHSFNAEYGRFAGGVISAVTRSGTNDYHGTVYEFVRNNIFDARNFFNPSDLPPFRRNQFGAAAGGRVIRDKMFFFANYEGLRERQGNTVTAGVPDANARRGLLPKTTATCPTGQSPTADPSLCQLTVSPGVIPYLALYPLPNGPNHGDGSGDWIVNYSSPTTEDYAMERMDFRLTDKDNFYWRYVFDPSSAVSPLPTPTFHNALVGTDHLVVLSETHVFSGASINEFRFGFNRSYAFQISSSIDPVDPSLSFVPGKAFGTISFSNASQTATSIATLGASMGSGTGATQNSFETGDTFSTVRGAHSLKFGFNFVRQQINNDYNSNGLGNYTFGGGLPALLAGQATQVRYLLTNATSFSGRGWRRNIFGWFVQDDYRVSPRLTLNLGLRHEFITNPAEVNGRTGTLKNITDTAHTPGPPFEVPKLNLSPRIGLAWDPTGSGKTSIRAGGGIYYNFLEGRNWYGNATNDPAFLSTISIASPVFPNAYSSIGGGSVPAQVFDSLQYDQETPTVIHYNLEVQRQLATTLSLRVGYIGSRSTHLSRQQERNTRPTRIAADGSKFYSASDSRINPTWANGRFITTDGVSNYDGLQMVLRKTVSAGLTFQASYTWAKTMSNADQTVTGQATQTAVQTMDPNDPKRDYSLSGFDQRHLFSLTGAYQMPWENRLNGRLAKSVLGGWVINGIFSRTTGTPIDIQTGFNRSLNLDNSNPDRPDLSPGANSNPIDGSTAGCAGIPGGQKLQTPERWYDPCPFTLPANGTWGNLGKNTVIGPGLINVDFTLVKTTPITESKKIEFRAEFFNLLNHANFGLPLLNLFSSNGTRVGNAGQITYTNSANRQIQFGLKLVF